MTEFAPWGKIARWNRDVVITEKIDGTNAAIVIESEPGDYNLALEVEDPYRLATIVTDSTAPDHADGQMLHIYAQSRTRLLVVDKDNFGFARWVQENAAELVALLGPGRHFGEWYGKGIQRGYSLDHKRFALFNVHRWGDGQLEADMVNGGIALPIDVVPVLDTISHPSSDVIEATVQNLHRNGSALVPGFADPEGIVVYHTAARSSFKVTCRDDEKPKGQA